MRVDVYQRVTDQIIAELEKGVRPWMKPLNAEHAAGRSPTPFGTMRSRNALSEKGQRRSMLLTRLGYRSVAAQS